MTKAPVAEPGSRRCNRSRRSVARTDYLTDFKGFQTFTVGGDSKNLFWHTPQYAAVEICNTLVQDAGRGTAAADAGVRPADSRRST